MADTLEIFGTEYTGVAGIIATNDQSTDLTYIRPQGTKNITANGTGIDVAEYASVDVSVPSGQPSLQSKTYNVSSAGTATVTADSGYDGLSSVSVSVPSASFFTGADSDFFTESGVRVFKVIPFTDLDSGEGDVEGFISDGTHQSGDPLIYSVVSATTVTPTESAQTVGGLNYMMEGAVTVNAIPSNYVGSGITQRSSSDLQAFDDVITVPAGYYAQQAEKSVGYTTLATPTATKGTVSNHSVSVTPSITQPYGYTDGGTKAGTAVTVSASELVSGTYTVDSSGTKDVTNYASASVPAGTAGTPSASKGAVSNHSVSVTPSVTNTTGWITGSTKTGTAVTVSASELVSGTLSVSDNGTSDCTNYASVNVNIPFVTYYTGSSTPSSSLGSNGDIYLKVVS